MNAFIKAIFTNPLGNTLAIINFVLIALNGSGVMRIFGADGLYSPVFLANIPARIASVVFSLFLSGEPRFGRSVVESYSLQDLGFVYLQWVVIGSIATSIAAEITQYRLSNKEMKGLLRMQSFHFEREIVNLSSNNVPTK